MLVNKASIALVTLTFSGKGFPSQTVKPFHSKNTKDLIPNYIRKTSSPRNGG